MKFNALKVAEVLAFAAAVGVSIAQGVVADKKLDIKVAEKVAEALENK